MAKFSKKQPILGLNYPEVSFHVFQLAAEYLTIKHETAKLQRYKEDLQKRLAETEAEEEEAPSQEDIEAVIKLQNEKVSRDI